MAQEAINAWNREGEPLYKAAFEQEHPGEIWNWSTASGPAAVLFTIPNSLGGSYF